MMCVRVRICVFNRILYSKKSFGKFSENMALRFHCIVTNMCTWIVLSAMTTSCIMTDGEMALFFFLKVSLTFRNILFQRCKKNCVYSPLVPFPRSGCKALLGK